VERAVLHHHHDDVVDAGARGSRQACALLRCGPRETARRERERAGCGPGQEATAVDRTVISRPPGLSSREHPTQEDRTMARASQKDLLSRLADAGEAAIKSLGDAPGADRF